MGRRARLRLGAALLLLAAATLTACGEDTAPAADTGSHDAAAGGILLSVPQAEQAARDWWSRDEQALARRPGAASLDQLLLDPEGSVVAHRLAVSIAVGQPLLAAPRQPQAVRVYVPAQQAYPVSVLAVFDVVPGNGGAAQHLAVLLVKRDAATPLLAQASAPLDGPEPTFDTDANGLVRTLATGADLSRRYAAYLDGALQGHPTTPPSFAPGKQTSELATADVREVRDTPAQSHGVISSVDLGYSDTAYSVPVFALKGGGGFTIAAVQRVEVLHPASGKQFFQDAARKNWGADLAPGSYAQITRRSFVIVVAEIPAASTPVTVVGGGGGTFSEG